MGETFDGDSDHTLSDAILSNINESVVIYKDLEIVYVNTPATNITGYSETEMLGESVLEYVADNSIPKVIENYKKRKQGESVPDVYDIELQPKNKLSTIPVEISVSETEYHDETVMVVVLRDISHRKQIEKEYEQIYRAFEHAAEAIYVTDADGSIQYVNNAFEQITGYTETEALGENPRIIKSGKMGDEYYKELWETLTDGKVWEERVINKRKNGELYHAQQTISPIKDGNGDISSFVAIQTDVTESIEQNQKLDMLTENLPGVIYQCGFDKTWPMRVIRGTQELIGYDSTTLENNDVSWGTDIIHPEDREQVWDTVQEAVGNEEPFTLVYRIITKTGDVKWVWERGRAVQTPVTQETVLEGIILNITERKKYENRFFETTRQLEVIGRILRHNLQNDMNVVLGNAEIITELNSGETEDRAKQITKVGEKLLETTSKEKKITRVLTDLDKPTVIDVTAAARQLTGEIEEQYPTANIEMCDCSVIEAKTSVHFTEAFTEIVTNAIVHSDKNTPEVSVSIEETNDFVEVQVSDNGPGIPKMEREVLTKDKIEPLYHGSGLGLWLVYIIMSDCGGDIKFTDNPDGTTVRLLLPKPK